ncbi:hypothetical protein D3C86_2066980 [compost metagenome]
MVGSDDNERFAVGVGEAERLSHQFIEIQHFRDYVRHDVGMAAIIHLCAFGHHKETFRVRLQRMKCFMK